MSQRVVLALDLVDDADSIAEYVRWHEVGRTPPEITKSQRDAGIENMEIFRAGTRMFMIIDARDDFSPEAKARMDEANPHVAAWQEHMAQFQQPIPAAGPGGSWHPMELVFRLTEHR